MCLLTYQKEPIILKEDKVVWKLLEEDLSASHTDFQYTLGVLNKQAIKFTTATIRFDDEQIMYQNESGKLLPNVVSIGEGFHSFYSEEYINLILARYATYRDCCKFKAIIPAGSEYYGDETGLCVSNQIIIVEKVD